MSLPMLLTVDEAADLLRTSRRAIYMMLERRQLPGVTRIGRRVLFRSVDLLNLDQRPSWCCWRRESTAAVPLDSPELCARAGRHSTSLAPLASRVVEAPGVAKTQQGFCTTLRARAFSGQSAETKNFRRRHRVLACLRQPPKFTQFLEGLWRRRERLQPAPDAAWALSGVPAPPQFSRRLPPPPQFLSTHFWRRRAESRHPVNAGISYILNRCSNGTR
jgi:excisionase family DNA binding protein